MRTSQQPQTGSFQQNLPRSPEQVIDRDRAGRSIISNNPTDLPYVDPQARYSISYVPGMSEHVVNTGKTLPEAQLKVVLLACEVERLNTLNYNLVKENEILKVQAKKSDRESDLETKLAIVLAENEKLNQIVEELHAVYARERESLTNDEYERRIAELLQDLEEWKQKYNRLEGGARVAAGSSGDAQAQAIIAELERDRENLREQLGRQGRDLQALRERLASIQLNGPADSKQLQEEINGLRIQNTTLASELDAMKLKYGNADALQQRLNQYDAKLRVLLAENDKLNTLLSEKVARDKAGPGPVQREFVEVVRPVAEEEKKAAAPVVPQQDIAKYKEIIERLTRDNEELTKLLTHSQSASAAVADLREKINRLVSENDRLNALVLELRSENEKQRKPMADLAIQLNNALSENQRLNDLLVERVREVEALRIRIRDLENQGANAGRVNILEQENQRLNGIIVDLRAENDRLKAGAVDSNRINQLTVQINGLLDENRRLNDLLNEKAQEVERLRKTQGGDPTRINQLTAQLNSLLDENQRLNNLLNERALELDRIRRRVSELEATNAGASSLSELRDKLVFITSENERLNNVILSLKAENDRLRAQTADVSRISSLTVQINTLLDDNQKLNNVLVDRSNELERLRRRIAELEQQGGSQDITRINTLTVQITGLLDDNRRLNDTLNAKLREIEDLRNRLASAQAQTGVNTGGNANDIRGQLVLISAESERLAQQLRIAEDKIRELQGEKDRANAQYLDRLREVDTLRVRISQLEVSGGAGGNNQELLHRINILEREIDSLRKALADKNNEIELFKRIPGGEGGSGDRQRVEILLQENERLNGLLTSKVREADILRSRIGDLERELGTEREKWNILLQEKQREIDSLRGDQARVYETTLVDLRQSEIAKNQSLKNSAAVRHDDAIRSLESRVKFLDEEIKRLTELLLTRDRELAEVRGRTGEVEFVRQENDRLNRLLTEKLREIEELRRNSAGNISELEYKRLLDAQITELTIRFGEERTELTNRLHQAEERLAALGAEHDRVSAQNEHNLQEIENWRRKYDQLERQRNAEFDLLKQDYEKRVRESPIRKSQLIQSAAELQQANDLLVADIQRLQDHLNLALGELEESRKKLKQVEFTKAQELEDLKQQFENARKWHIEARELHVKFNAERLAYETQILQLQQKIADLETQVGMVANENDRHGKLSQSRLEEVEDYRRKYNELKAAQNIELTQLRSQVESYKARGQEVKQLAIKYSADKAADQAQIRQLKQVIENYKSEIEKLHELLEQNKVDFGNLTKQNEDFAAQIEQLLTQQVRAEGNQVADRVNALQRELAEAEKGREEYKKQANRNSIELTRKNKELVDKLQELDIVKMKYEEALANYQALNTRLFEKLGNM